MKEITIIGNIGANAVLRQTSDGRSLMTFSVAVNNSNNETLWFNCVANYRERLFPYLEKGTQVCVMGDLQAKDYQGKIDLSVNVDKMELCGTKSEKGVAVTTEEQNTTGI